MKKEGKNDGWVKKERKERIKKSCKKRGKKCVT